MRVQLVIISLAGGVLVQHPARLAVEGMLDGDNVGQQRLRLPTPGPRQARTQGVLHFPDTLFDGAVVLRIKRGAVERDDAIVGEHRVHCWIVAFIRPVRTSPDLQAAA